eukprot:2611327-Pyramimonas_sp.AAC.1
MPKQRALRACSSRLQFAHRSSAKCAGATSANASRFIRNSCTKRTARPPEYRAQIRERRRG